MKLELKDYILIGLVIIFIIVLIPKISFGSPVSPGPAPTPSPSTQNRTCADPIPVSSPCPPPYTQVTTFSPLGDTKTCCVPLESTSK